jgi:antitoxin MazE
MAIETVKTTIRKLGNSQGVLIPKSILAQVGLQRGDAEMTVEGDAIVLRRPKQAVRAGWAESCAALHLAGGDTLVWPDFSNAADDDLAW